MYLADSLISLEHDDLSDLEKPASIRFVTKGKRGNTDLNTALVAIRVESLFDHLPKYFRTKENDEAPEAGDSEKPAADGRLVDNAFHNRMALQGHGATRLQTAGTSDE
jgi:hypothetical protein